MGHAIQAVPGPDREEFGRALPAGSLPMTQAVWQRQRSRRLDGPVQRVAWRKLAMLDAAETLTDLLIPPGNRLEKLTGDRAGQYSIRINQQWRIWATAGRTPGQKMWRSSTIAREEPVTENTVMPPVHPGEILLEEFLQPLSVSQYQLAKAIDVPARRINEIVHGQRRITADTALRLSRYFGTSERFWLNLQSRYDLETEKDRLGTELDDIRPLSAAS
jgi:addiction module HigA family antidote